MDLAKKFISEIYEKREHESEIDQKLDAIKSSFNERYKKWSAAKQSESSSTHGNLSAYGDLSPTRNSSRGRPKANRVETSSELPDHTIHGFINEYLFLKNFLVKQKESEEFKALAIVGKYGVGKTTLCQVVFNNKDVKDAYFPRIWVSMYIKETKEDEDPFYFLANDEDPKSIDKKKKKKKKAVVKRILRSLGVEKEMLKRIQNEAEEEKRNKEEAGEGGEETVTEKELSRLLYALHLNLIGKKYLIILDDVWEDNEWNQRLDGDKNQQEKTHLSYGFPKGSGGRVIVTSRDESLAKKIVGEEENLQRLFPRPDAESVWKIYKDAATALGIDVNPRYPVRFKQELMEKSCGIPLAARMLAKIEPAKKDEHGGDMARKESF